MTQAPMFPIDGGMIAKAVTDELRHRQEHNNRRLRDAVRNEGPRPDIHRTIMAKHRKEWPTLWAAIDAILEGEGK